ncbi:MAG: GNAT family N-acetyltransferase [Vulcanimicrobiaceae bacterium]
MSSAAAFRSARQAAVAEKYAGLVDFAYDRSHVALVAEEDGKQAGFVLMLDDLPDDVTGQPQAFVAYMAVEPEMRELGIGTALLAAAEDEARKRGLSYIALMVTEENRTARGLYERAGYVTERRLLCKIL